MGLKNYMSLEIGGKVRGLKFNIGTLKCLGEITGVDPLSYKAEGSEFKDLLPYTTQITHAALLSNCLSKKEAPDFTGEDVALWMDELSGFDMTEIITCFNGIFKPPTPAANGEVSKDTQSGQVANV